MLWSWPVPGHVPWEIPTGMHDGAFGVRRKHDYHTGIDLYCPSGTPVFAVEAGTVTQHGPFTGALAESPFWHDTDYLMVMGASGVVCYGELALNPSLQVGSPIEQGQRLGTIKQVLKKDKGKPMSMLHLELYRAEYKGGPVWWNHGESRPESLLDPTQRLRDAWSFVTNRFHRDSPAPPTTQTDRKALVCWLLDHPLWTHPYEFRNQLKGADCSGAVDIGSFQEVASFDFVYVDPTLERIHENSSQNTVFRVWIETGGWIDLSKDPENNPPPPEGWNQYNKWTAAHDTNLDCGGADMEEALINLAMRVRWLYGDAGRSDGGPGLIGCGGDFTDPDLKIYQTRCQDAGDGFCSKCGYLL